ncbi:MAG TPA: response regulator transcription factor [Rhodopila sp.]|nr:response regulator transcription factor [Rhodopila sp.]
MHVLVADAQFLIRQGIVSFLGSRFPQWSFLHSCSLVEILAQLDAGQRQPDPAVIDPAVIDPAAIDPAVIDPAAIDPAVIDLALIGLDLPGMNGSAGIRILREASPTLRIALLTGSEDWDTLQDCLAAGARGCLPKEIAAEDLARATHTLMSGGVYLPSRRLNDQPAIVASAALVSPAMPALTARQRDVLALLVDGRSTKDIAKNLNLGIGTVKVHLGGIYRTLAVRNRAEAVARFRATRGSIV